MGVQEVSAMGVQEVSRRGKSVETTIHRRGKRCLHQADASVGDGKILDLGGVSNQKVEYICKSQEGDTARSLECRESHNAGIGRKGQKM
jgi:hypothetical protein